MWNSNETDDVSTLLWKIENFSMCSYDSIESEKFVIDVAENLCWKLKLFPRGDKDKSWISCYVCTDSKNINMKFQVSILCANGSLLSLPEIDVVPASIECGYKNFISRSELFKSADLILSKDILTLRCQIWKSDEKLFSNLMLSKTWVDFEQRSFIWNIKSYGCPSSVKATTNFQFSNSTGIFIHFNKSSEKIQSDDLNINITVKSETYRAKFMKCNVSIVGHHGKSLISTKGECLFKWASDFLLLSLISHCNLMENLNLYLPNGVLILQFDFKVSGDVRNSNMVHSFCPIRVLKRNSSLKKDLLSLYSNRKFCDVTLRSKDKTFQAHKSILSARSTIFDAMFQDKVSENTIWVVDIPDVEPDVLDEMLKYMYSECLENLEWESAKKLYIAARLYKIPSLAEECSTFLKFKAFPGKFSQISDLAELHQDEDLRKSVQDLVSFHAI